MSVAGGSTRLRPFFVHGQLAQLHQRRKNANEVFFRPPRPINTRFTRLAGHTDPHWNPDNDPSLLSLALRQGAVLISLLFVPIFFAQQLIHGTAQNTG